MYLWRDLLFSFNSFAFFVSLCVYTFSYICVSVCLSFSCRNMYCVIHCVRLWCVFGVCVFSLWQVGAFFVRGF